MDSTLALDQGPLVMGEMTWALVHAAERSHSWTVFRGIGRKSRTCWLCGDTEESPVRYCPGKADV